MPNDNFCVSFDDEGGEKDLQASFKSFLKSRQIQLLSQKMRLKFDKTINKQKLSDSDRRDAFVRQACRYIGVPYAKRYWTEQDAEYHAKYFLDCCALVRRVMRDLADDFGFRLGPWNQGYMFDLLPIEYEDPSEMKPGDLVFVEGIYFNERRKPQRHNIMHVEIWLGDGEKTVGARWQRGVVKVFDSYRFESENYRITRFVFKSIDTWLQGIRRSFCKEHNWHHIDHFYIPGKYSIFTNYQESQEKQEDEACDSTETDNA